MHRYTVEQLGKRSDLIAISVAFVDPALWFVGGGAIGGGGRRSFALEVKIANETKTRGEKARYIAAVLGALERCLGPLHEQSDIHLHDVRAGACGFGGRTQEWRHHRAVVTRSWRWTAYHD